MVSSSDPHVPSPLMVTSPCPTASQHRQSQALHTTSLSGVTQGWFNRAPGSRGGEGGGSRSPLSGAAHGGSVCSGHHRRGSAGPRPCAARTKPRSCCPPHLRRQGQCESGTAWDRGQGGTHMGERNRGYGQCGTKQKDRRGWIRGWTNGQGTGMGTQTPWTGTVQGWTQRQTGRTETDKDGGALTDAAHNALVGDGGHEVWVLLGACVALGPEHAVGILWQGRSPEM